MSFNINGPSYKPMIQESQSMKNNGGGGNTGYFQRGRKKKEEKESTVFSEAETQDEFTPETKDPKPVEKKEKLLNKFIEKTKDAVNKFKQDEKNEQNEQKTNNPFSPLDNAE